MAKKILRQAAEVGIEEAGTRFCGSGWPIVKKVLSPIVDELQRRYPKLLLVSEEMEKAQRALSEDKNLEALLHEELAALGEGHMEIMKVLARHDETLQSYRDLIFRAFREADEKNQARHERVIAEIAGVKTEISGLAEQIGQAVVQPHLSIDEIYRQANGYQADAMKWISAEDADTASQRLVTGRALAMGGLAREEHNARLMVTLGFIEKSQAQVCMIRNDPEGATQNLALAAKYFSKALELDPADLDALNGMANVYYYGHDYDSAIQLGLAVVKANPLHGPALNDLSLSLENKIKESGPEPDLLSKLIVVYETLEKLMPLMPQLFPASYLAYVQRRLAELRKQTTARTDSLHDAVRNNSLGEVTRFVNSGTDINVKDENADTPLHLAAQKGHKAIAEFLIANDASIDAKGQCEFTPLCWAARRGHKALAELLIKKGATVNVKDIFGVTPLHWAAYNNLPDLVELFLVNGANVNAKDKNSNTPLRLAAGHAKTVSLLKQYGAKE